MKCPLCNTSMIVVERDKIELDYCTTCSGIWFDAGELELLLDDMTGQNTKATLEVMLSRPLTDYEEQTCKCPICRKNLQKIDIGKKNKLVVDMCKSGHGMWFDGGEVGQLINQLGIKQADDATAQDRMLFFLADTFKAKPGLQGQ